MKLKKVKKTNDRILQSQNIFYILYLFKKNDERKEKIYK